MSNEALKKNVIEIMSRKGIETEVCKHFVECASNEELSIFVGSYNEMCDVLDDECLLFFFREYIDATFGN